MNGWIDCRERMPKDHEMVLVRITGYYRPAIGAIRYMAGSGDMQLWDVVGEQGIGYRNLREVTHWQPLPGMEA